MELRHLRYFVAVAEELHFTRAAERLHIGQPPLSQQIQALEAELDVQLFERNKRSVRLTAAGLLFLDDARRILGLSEQAATTARRAHRGEIGELRIGFTYSTPFTPLFARVINRYRQLYPEVTLTLLETGTLHQIDAISQRAMDLGFLRPPEVVIPDTIVLTVLHEDRMLAVLPVEHPLAARAQLALADLAGVPFVMYSKKAGTGFHPRLLRLCRAAGFEPLIGQEAGEAPTIIGLVAAGCGISVLPTPFDSIHMEGVCYRPITDPDASTSLMLARRRDGNTPLIDAFVRLAHEAALVV
jgi:DNA-binding transcriptional LysR family regulator